MDNLEQCRLCLREKPLADSHIIPEFLYKPLYDEAHRMHFFRGNEPAKDRLIQKGIREPLLCNGKDSCEQHISRWERYAAQVFNPKLIEGKPYNDVLVKEGIDYSSFKLFQMSILWRASVSGIIGFREVRLGPHQERLRSMLLNDDPGEEHEFGCMMMIRSPFLQWSEQLIVSPYFTRYQGHNSITFIINGIIWEYWVSSHTSKLPQYFITKSGELPFVRMPEVAYDSLILRATRGLLY